MKYLINFLEKKSNLFYIRKIMLFTTFMYLVFGLLYETSILKEDPISLYHRLFPATVFFLFYLGGFFINKIKNNIYKIFYYLILFANIHLLYLAFINNMSINFAFSIIVVIFISNLLLKPQVQLKTFNIIMIVLVSTATIYITDSLTNKFVFLMIFYVITIASFIISKLSYLSVKNIKERKSYYQNLFKKSPIGLVRCDNIGKVLDINEYMVELSQAKDKEYFIGKNIFNILDKKNINLDKIDRNKSFECEVSFSEDENIWLEMTVENIEEKDQNVYILAFKDITSNKKLEQELTYLSFHDQMTGLYNYRYFKNEIERFNKSRQLPISILIIDIDRLKSINDSKGHIKGNRIIKNTADILQRTVRDEDILARVGGDEFGIILPNTSEETAEKISKRIYDEIDNYNELENTNTVISISIGWATKEEKGKSLYEIIELADQNMYESKEKDR